MAASVNPQMIGLARKARGLTQQKLAEKASVSQGFVSKAENGFIEVSDDRLDALANALKYPPTFFLQADRALGSPCHHRKRRSMPVHRLEQLEAGFNITRMQVQQLLQEVDVPEPRFPRLDIDEYESTEEIAKLVRRTWHLPMGPIQNLVQAVEAAGGIIVRSNFETDKLDAISQRAADGRPFFFLNDAMPGDRQRFNLAHELGHIFMHTVPSFGDQEKEAHRFAGALLMPAQEIAPQLNNLSISKLAELKAYWRVAMQAIVMRAYHLGKITSRQQRSFFTRMTQLGYRKNEPVPIEQEKPMIIKQIIDVHATEHGYSTADMSALARLHESEFRVNYLGEQPRTLRLVN